MRPAIAVGAVSLLFLLATAAAALEPPAFCDSALDPLLYVLRSESPNERRDVFDNAFFVFRDRTILLLGIHRTEFRDLPLFAGMARARAAPNAMGDLATALAAGRIGVQRDCSYSPIGVSSSATLLIQWFGARGRRNSFQVATHTSFPPCSAETQLMVEKILGFKDRPPTVLESVGVPHF